MSKNFEANSNTVPSTSEHIHIKDVCGGKFNMKQAGDEDDRVEKTKIIINVENFLISYR